MQLWQRFHLWLAASVCSAERYGQKWRYIGPNWATKLLQEQWDEDGICRTDIIWVTKEEWKDEDDTWQQ